MNHSILKQVIFDQREVIRSAEIIDRDYCFEKNVNYILVGLRRAGKSSLLYRMVKDLIEEGGDWSQIIYINFEDDRLLGFQKDDFNDIVETAHELSATGEVYYFFDEIQIIDGWEHFARRMADQKKHVQITGSNAKMLSSDLSTLLAGRYQEIHVHSLTYPEFLVFHELKDDDNSLYKYLNYGGLPGLRQIGTEDEEHVHDYQQSVVNTVVLKDIIERHSIRNVAFLNKLLQYLADNTGKPISATNISNSSGCSCIGDRISHKSEQACKDF